MKGKKVADKFFRFLKTIFYKIFYKPGNIYLYFSRFYRILCIRYHWDGCKCICEHVY